MWEFEHLVENSMKYKLWPADPAALPQCRGGAAWLTTTMDTACYNVSPGGGSSSRGLGLACCCGCCCCRGCAEAGQEMQPRLWLQACSGSQARCQISPRRAAWAWGLSLFACRPPPGSIRGMET